METGEISGSVGYKKDLRLIHLVMLNCMGMIGSGWLFASFHAASSAGPLGSIIAWIVGGIFVLFISFTFMEVSPMLPKAGGSTYLAEFSHGKMTGFIAGWSGWLSDVMTPPAEALAVVTYASYYLPQLIVESGPNTGTVTVYGYLVAGIAMAVMWFLNTFRVRRFGDITTAIMVWKWAIPIIAIIGIMAFAFHPANFSAYGTFGNSGVQGIPQAVIGGGIVFSFLGFRGVVNMAGEVKKPKTIASSIIIAVITVTLLYIFLDIAFVGGINWSAAGITAGNWSAISTSNLISGPFAQEASEAGLGILATLLLIDAVISPGGTGITYEAYPARIFQAMSINGYVPKVFGKLHPKTSIPFNALALSAILGFAFLYKFPSWSLIIGILTTTLVVAYLVGPVSVMVFRKTIPGVERPYKLPGAKVIAPIAFVLSYIAIYWSGWPLTWQVAAVVLVGLVIYFYYHAKSKFGTKHVTAGLWYVAGILVVVAESYIGPSLAGGLNIIPFPFDLILVTLTALFFYFWSQRSGWLTPSLEAETKNMNSKS